MAILNSLTPRALDFLEKNSAQWSVNAESEPSHVGSLSQSQAEIAERLRNVNYKSKCSFQDKRFTVSFFPPNGDEPLDTFIRRRGFYCNRSFYIPGCNTDETHFPDGIALSPSGQLVMPREDGTDDIVYESPCVVIERDAFLASEQWEYIGSVNLSLEFDWRKTSSLLNDFSSHGPAQDEFNLLLHSEDVVCIVQDWLDYYRPGFIPKEVGPVVRVFGYAKNAFGYIVSKLCDVSHSFAECDRA